MRVQLSDSNAVVNVNIKLAMNNITGYDIHGLSLLLYQRC